MHKLTHSHTLIHTRTAGQDFTGVSETLLFTPLLRGRPQPVDVPIEINDDSLIEGQEEFSVRLSLSELDAELGNVVVVNPVAFVTIEDNDSEWL